MRITAHIRQRWSDDEMGWERQQKGGGSEKDGAEVHMPQCSSEQQEVCHLALCSVLGLTVYYCTLRFLSLICSKYCKLCRGFNNSYTLKWSYFAYFLESDQIMSIYVQIIPMMQNLRLQTAEPRAVSTEAPPTHIERGSQSQERWVKWRAEEAKTVWFKQRMDGWKVQCKRKRIYFN